MRKIRSGFSGWFRGCHELKQCLTHLWGSGCGCPHSLADSFKIHRFWIGDWCYWRCWYLICRRRSNFWCCKFLGLDLGSRECRFQALGLDNLGYWFHWLGGRYRRFWDPGLGLTRSLVAPDASGAMDAKSCSAIRIPGEDSFASSNKGADQVGTGASWGLSSCKGQAGIPS